ncbi:MAG: hypothetical protein BWK76_27560 [Desulfobulbaceae bacterium A2]|nr:MAG: hypothetical protein BWK76_27560 [Desulfobulbaceae bacterium A2]
MKFLQLFKRGDSCRFLVDPAGSISRKFAHFKVLLESNNQALDIIARLEETYYGGAMFSPGVVRQHLAELAGESRGLVEALEAMAPGRYPALAKAQHVLMADAREAFQDAPLVDGPLVLPLAEVTAEHRHMVGGKAANLALMRNDLGLPVPEGFVVTTAGFARFLAHNGLGVGIQALLEEISPYDPAGLRVRCDEIRAMVLGQQPPPDLVAALTEAFARLPGRAESDKRIALRSSAVGEDGAASFAGQYETVLNVSEGSLTRDYMQVVASKYTPTAVLYRLRYGLDEGDTPMAVLGLEMISSQASGVLYTVDPSSPSAGVMRLDGVWGLGELLVSGAGMADSLRITRKSPSIVERHLARKDRRLVPLAEGGVRSETLPVELRESQCLEDAAALALACHGLALEQHFGRAQDVEWAIDPSGKLVLLQSRPLGLMEEVSVPSSPPEAPDPLLHPVLLRGGQTAARGAASGIVRRVVGEVPTDIPEGSILLCRNAAPELAALLDRAAGLVTETGGVASHLASVARELGIPALFGLEGGMEMLVDGEVVTLDAGAGVVYRGRVPALLVSGAAVGHVVDSPMHRRLRRMLDHIAPLHLTDPASPAFMPEGCRSIHDLIRFVHEVSMREMFGLHGGADDETAPAVRVKAMLPLALYCVDLGGGLRHHLTTCDQVTPADFRSLPMLALWRGFTHPGVSWEGTMALDGGKLLSLLASSATAEVGGGVAGGDSYALLAGEYMNVSVRFGYHFATIDAYCGEVANHNYISLRFSGGAGSFAGKSLRLGFLSGVLARLGFLVTVTGDVLDARFKGAARQQSEDALDQLGRLLASSRLLDMTIANHGAVASMIEDFFRGRYDYLGQRSTEHLPAWYLPCGDWDVVEEDGRRLARQDGRKWATGLSREFAALMGRFSGQRYQRFLDSIEAYFYFPLAIAREVSMVDGRTSLQVRPVAGEIDQAGGLAFGLRNAGNYLVLRINALENNLMLFRFRDGARQELASVHVPVPTGEWREIAVEIVGGEATCLLDGRPLLHHHEPQPIRGHVGLWAKADSVTDFTGLTVATAAGPVQVPL